MENELQQDNRVELPLVTAEHVENKHVSLLLIEDGLRQVEVNLKEQDENIIKINDNLQKLSEQLQRLQSLKIATTAQQNLLLELQRKIVELDNAGNTAT